MTALITLNQIKAHHPCKHGWIRLRNARGGENADFDLPFPLSEAFKSNNFCDVIWALRCLPNGKELAVKFALGCAEMVRHLMRDNRSIAALDGIAAYLRGESVDMQQIRNAAYDAAYAADAAHSYVDIRDRQKSLLISILDE